VAVARIMELVNATRKAMDGAPGPADPAVREAAEVITIALSLVRAVRCRGDVGTAGSCPSVANATWPAVDSSLLVTQAVTCVVQVQGKVRGRLEVPPGITEDELRSRALAEESVVRALAGREVAKVIIRAPKLVSIVAR
jgi:leucyl-tRNA synthetase